jgi:epoxyqueuosine reductase
LGIKLCLTLEDKGIYSVLIPSDEPYEYWEEDNKHGRGILSLRHAGYFAGLGAMARNTLLVNEKYGNMLFIGAVLVDIKLKEDPMVTYECCNEKCNLCIDSCPQKALDGVQVNQKLCRDLSIRVTERGHSLYNCCKCRILCPNYDGIKKVNL